MIVAPFSTYGNEVTNHNGVVYLERFLLIIWIVVFSILDVVCNILSLIDSTNSNSLCMVLSLMRSILLAFFERMMYHLHHMVAKP